MECNLWCILRVPPSKREEDGRGPEKIFAIIKTRYLKRGRRGTTIRWLGLYSLSTTTTLSTLLIAIRIPIQMSSDISTNWRLIQVSRLDSGERCSAKPMLAIPAICLLSPHSATLNNKWQRKKPSSFQQEFTLVRPAHHICRKASLTIWWARVSVLES